MITSGAQDIVGEWVNYAGAPDRYNECYYHIWSKKPFEFVVICHLREGEKGFHPGDWIFWGNDFKGRLLPEDVTTTEERCAVATAIVRMS